MSLISLEREKHPPVVLMGIKPLYSCSDRETTGLSQRVGAGEEVAHTAFLNGLQSVSSFYFY